MRGKPDKRNRAELDAVRAYIRTISGIADALEKMPLHGEGGTCAQDWAGKIRVEAGHIAKQVTEAYGFEWTEPYPLGPPPNDVPPTTDAEVIR